MARPTKRVDDWAWALHRWGVRPNHLTFLQLPFLAALAYFGYTKQWFAFGTAQLLVVLVDGADGTLARRTHTTTRRGHLLDSFMDILGIGITLWVVSRHYPNFNELSFALLFVNFLVYIQNEIQGTKSVTYTRGPVTAGICLAQWLHDPDLLIVGLALPLVLGVLLMVSRVDWRRRLWNYYQFLTAGRRREYKAVPRAERAALVQQPPGSNLPARRAPEPPTPVRPRDDGDA